jgi:hypothetical protein
MSETTSSEHSGKLALLPDAKFSGFPQPYVSLFLTPTTLTLNRLSF